MPPPCRLGAIKTKKPVGKMPKGTTADRTKCVADVANVGAAKSGMIPTLTKRGKFVFPAKLEQQHLRKNKRKKSSHFLGMGTRRDSL